MLKNSINCDIAKKKKFEKFYRPFLVKIELLSIQKASKLLKKLIFQLLCPKLVKKNFNPYKKEHQFYDFIKKNQYFSSIFIFPSYNFFLFLYPFAIV